MTPIAPETPPAGAADPGPPPEAVASTGARAGSRRGPSLGCMIGLLLGGAVVAILLGLGLVVFAWRAGHRRVIDEELARLRAAGKPTTLAELADSWRVDPDRPDATDDWLAAIALVRRPARATAYHDLLLGSNVPDDYRESFEVSSSELAAFLAAQGEVYAAIDRAAAAGSNVRYPADVSQGLMMVLDDELAVRAVANWLDVRTVLALREGRVDDALASLEATVAALETLADEPLLLCQLVRFADLGIVFTRIEDLLASQAVTPDQLDRIERLLDPIDTRSGLATALDGERALVLTALESGSIGSSELDQSDSLALYRLTPVVVADERFAVEFFRDLDAALARESPAAMLDGIDLATRTFQASAKNSLVPPYVTQSLVPSLQTTGNVSARGEASRQNLLAGVAARRYALIHGRLPRTADELATVCPGGLPSDPYDGQSVKVVAVDDALRVAPALSPSIAARDPGPGVAYYSVGENRVDDGGVRTGVPSQGDWLIFLPETLQADRLDPPPGVDPVQPATEPEACGDAARPGGPTSDEAVPPP